MTNRIVKHPRIEPYHDGFGLYLLDLSEAAALVVKSLSWDMDLDKRVPEDKESEWSFYSTELEEFYASEIAVYKEKIIKGIKNGTLKTKEANYDLDDNLIEDDTYIDLHELNEWLEQRGGGLSGDILEDYLKDIEYQAEAAQEAIIAARSCIMNANKFPREQTHESQIAALESEITDLKEMLDNKLQQEPKELSTRERKTLYKMLIGMAVSIYNYDAKASKSSIPKEIENDLAVLGIDLTDETIRTYLKKAYSEFPVSNEND